MRIRCTHGYFHFEESEPGQMSRFMQLFGFELARAEDHFTFADLVEAPDYSIAGGTFLGCPTTETFAGRPWEVMRANGLVYDFLTGLVVPVLGVIQQVSIAQSGSSFVAPGMILPGSVTDDGSRVTDYSAFFFQDRMSFKYSEVGYDG